MALIETMHRLTVGSLILGATMLTGSVAAQELPEPAAVESEIPGAEFGAPRILEQDGSILSLPGGRQLMVDADAAIAQGNYALAEDKLKAARQVFNQLSNFYQQLSSTFSGINSRLSDQQRRSALEAAQLRDRATYKLALVHKEKGQPELALPLLVQIVRSQNPTSELGGEAYEQLVFLGLITSSDIPIPPDVVPPSSLISIPGGQELMAQSEAAVDQGDYQTARERLQQARQVFNQLSNFHQQLAQSFSGINPEVSQDQRQKALVSAELRDQSTYQLALVHRAQGQPELSVPLLIQIVRSQNPSSALGKQSYQQLVELGFVDAR